MDLTGDPAGPPLAPATSAAPTVDAALAPFGLDASVLAERAASAGLARGGRASCGRGSRLLQAADGWLALSLSRADDVASLPALLDAGFDGEPDGTGDAAPWERAARLVAARPAAEVAARAEMLGMPCGVVAEPVAAPPLALIAEAAPDHRRPPYVVDLSALWAGPLATSCLRRVGATVVKVEDVRRPDGARRGDPAFYDLLNGGKLSVALDLGTAGGRRALASLVDRADIVVTSARARAVEALGLDPEAALAGAGDKVWVAITAHGWGSSRVGFGDDVAAAAGLVAWHPDGEPRFAADAIADPLAGALAAHAALAAWQQGGRHFVDASLAAAAHAVAPPAGEPARPAEPGWSIDGEPVASPRPRPADRPAAALGADTDAVLAAVSA